MSSRLKVTKSLGIWFWAAAKSASHINATGTGMHLWVCLNCWMAWWLHWTEHGFRFWTLHHTSLLYCSIAHVVPQSHSRLETAEAAVTILDDKQWALALELLQASNVGRVEFHLRCVECMSSLMCMHWVQMSSTFPCTIRDACWGRRSIPIRFVLFCVRSGRWWPGCKASRCARHPGACC